jgi:hypothetical protein
MRISCSPRHAIFGECSLLRQVGHVALPNVDLAQSLELNHRKLAHDCFGGGAGDAELCLQSLCVEEGREWVAQVTSP